MSAAGHSVGEVARIAKVTVRTLHHYDEIGLLRPSTRSTSGHRRYSDGDLTRLQQIRYYRELGFSLDEVAAILDDPGADPMVHLRRQHGLLLERAERLTRMAAAVAQAMEAHRMGIDLTPEERFEVFGEDDPERYAEEAERRWGGTEAYAESRRRAAGRTKEDWIALKRDWEEAERHLAALLGQGVPADDPRAMDAAEELRLQIERHHYPCPHGTHRAMAALYVEDERFTAHYERIAPGLARYTYEAVCANADRHAEG
ncbi:MerR family transcriptional regulator [Streptomyces capparidis]